MSKPLVSIGIPVYNGEKYLREALDSVLAQSYTNFEVIISDNCSTDRTENICLEYVAKDKRIQYHRALNNRGALNNFRLVLEKAKGKYFTWLAHDDLLSDSNYINYIVDYMETHSDVALCGSSIHQFIDNDPTADQFYQLNKIHPQIDWNIARLEFFRLPQNITHFVIYGVYRREFLVKIPINERKFRDIPIAIEWENPVLANLCSFGRIVALPEIARKYRFHIDSSAYSEFDKIRPIDYFLLTLDMKWKLLKIAYCLPLKIKEKYKIILTTIKNYFTAPFGRLPELKIQMKQFKIEITLLRNICEERLALINRLHHEMVQRDELIMSLQSKLENNK